ncbi:hypothetical protein FOE78_04945 [Microlunatus elymi]|uniref:Uncharacterized protein n=1 Tax=Microlunatus elymi TaxID=2596828 RepID=A0A516PVY2_9ACTN|nr:hypothetical protein [Microlunatus elymi]QDP95344.1 hypothetical protein FOE78_04945 [Microlunatus elymi]
MTATIEVLRQSLPPVARLGFDDGWHLLPATFLNLKMPVLIVDRAYIGDPSAFGLEQLGARDPKTPIPRSCLDVELLDNLLWIRDQESHMIIAGSRLNANCLVKQLALARTAALLIGSSYQLELSCLALWSMFIGTANVSPAATRR